MTTNVPAQPPTPEPPVETPQPVPEPEVTVSFRIEPVVGSEAPTLTITVRNPAAQARGQLRLQPAN